MTTLIEKFRQSSALYGGNAAFIEELYEDYLKDPDSVSSKWRDYFEGLRAAGDGEASEVPHRPIRDSFARLARLQPVLGPARAEVLAPMAAEKQASVLRIINAYRTRGHQAATLDPLDLRERPPVPDLEPSFHSLTVADMDSVFNTGSLHAPPQMTLREILALVSRVYTGNVGSEYMHITKTEEKRWIQKRLEGSQARLDLSEEERLWTLKMLVNAEGLEKYLHNKYVGQKRFSLEGGDALIPMLDDVIQRAGSQGVREIVIGMAHRGRLNVLVNAIGKSPNELFAEFAGRHSLGEEAKAGDVKYHMGFSSDVSTPGGPVHLALSFNPSHLEIIDPVVEGSVRARIQRRAAARESPPFNECLPVLIHGDAAFAGQGVILETLQLSQVRGYRTGGTVHIIVNNQIGFTTSNPLDARSAHYCTDVAKMVQSPIFHVNGDDPEAVLFVTRLALDYRMTFNKDVVVDLVCYRRHGHNEADEPSATQPMMYKKIRSHATPLSLYADALMREGVVTKDQVEQMRGQYRDDLDNGRDVSRPILSDVDNPFAVDWSRLRDVDWSDPGDTAVPIDNIRRLSERMLALPEGFELHPRVAKIMADRRKMAAGALSLDWGFAENLAYATLLDEGFQVRISGQDCGRGTFFHRHAALHNQLDGRAYVPLKNLAENQPAFLVIDSILSEEAVMGFEYGYSLAEPNGLAIWEGQFGDFANGAQVVIDQFIAAGETKWGRFCGLTLLLPHGYEGQGPEHSSARLERFLQLCADHNMQVCVPSTPAQAFHMLRRQLKRPFRKPLIVMSPKSLLRHKLAVNTLEDLSQGHFQNVIGEVDELRAKDVERIVYCSGKVYYDLWEARKGHGLGNVALIRVEQLHPFPEERYIEELQRYPKANTVVWCQEEPRNQGAWYQIQHHLREGLTGKLALEYAGRAASASPAVGLYSVHVEEQRTLVHDALGLAEPS